MDRTHDVVIVGGGPVGTGLAIDLGRRGLPVALIEKYAAPQPIPKGQNLTQRTMEHFRAWGIEDRLRAARTIPPGQAVGGMTSYGTLLSGWHYDWFHRERVREFYATENERLPQYATEAVLRAAAAELPSIEVFSPATATGLVQDEAGVTLEIATPEGGRRLLRGAYAIGCDGARSLVRTAAGVSETRRDHDRKMVLLVFRSPALQELVSGFPSKQFYNVLHPEHEGYWLFFGRVDLGETWFFHAPVPADATESYDFAGLLHSAVGQTFELEIQHVGFWDLRVAHANNYRAGRVFVAGDAAHSHPPYGGYGINTGLEDVRNLGWKLAAEREGWAGPGLLGSYDAERRPVFASTAHDFIENFIEEDREFLARWRPEEDPEGFAAAWARRAEGDPSVNAFEPNYEGSPIVWAAGSPSARGRHEHRARAGHHLGPATLSDGRPLDVAFGDGFTLLALDAAAAEIAAAEAAALDLGVPLAILADSAEGERARFACRLALVRPDGFVAWTGETFDGRAREIIARSVGHSVGNSTGDPA